MRRLLCANSSCPICNAVALEIQQLLAGENTLIFPTSPGPSQGSSFLEILPISNVSFEQRHGSPHLQELSFPSATPSKSQLMNQKSLTQSASQSMGAVSIQDCGAKCKLRQELQAPDVSRDAVPLSSSLEERRIPMNPQDKKSHSECVLGKQGQQLSKT